MTYGVLTTRSDGTQVLNQTMPGGRVYVGLINRSDSAGGVVTTFTYPEVPGGSNLRLLQVGAANHTYTVGTNGSGHATVTLTSVVRRVGFTRGTLLLVFATATTEPDFGIATVNNAGERTVSSVFPTPEFLGKITFSGTPTFSEDVTEGAYWRYYYSTSTSLGAGRTRMILWSLPNYDHDIWFEGSSFVGSGITGAYNVGFSYIANPNVPRIMPEAFIFALDGLSSSADTYGMRVFNASGQLTFDAGLNHMVIRGYETTVDYPTATGTTFTYSNLSSLGGNMPAFLVPQYFRESWTRIGQAVMSRGEERTGGMQRSGTTLRTRLVRTATYFEDAVIQSSDVYGLSTDITQVVVDATQYGGVSAFPLDATVSWTSGSAACSFDGGGSNNSVTCTSSSNWTVLAAGGNNNAYSYSWSIISNPGGLSITAGSTSQTCTVSKTASAPTSSSSTYSCTLRCTISQSGVSSITRDVTVTHTHTDTWVDSGGGGGY